MKKVKFYAVQTLKGEDVMRFELGVAMQDEYGRISARRYDEFKRAMFKLQSHSNRFSVTKSYTFYLTNEYNERDTFGGYPARGFLDNGVKFEKNTETFADLVLTLCADTVKNILNFDSVFSKEVSNNE